MSGNAAGDPTTVHQQDSRENTRKMVRKRGIKLNGVKVEERGKTNPCVNSAVEICSTRANA